MRYIANSTWLKNVVKMHPSGTLSHFFALFSTHFDEEHHAFSDRAKPPALTFSLFFHKMSFQITQGRSLTYTKNTHSRRPTTRQGAASKWHTNVFGDEGEDDCRAAVLPLGKSIGRLYNYHTLDASWFSKAIRFSWTSSRTTPDKTLFQ